MKRDFLFPANTACNFQHSSTSPGSTLTRDSPLRRSFNDHAWARTYTESNDDLANNIFSCLSLTDLAFTRPP